MKIFISQPMSGRDWDDILNDRVKVLGWAKRMFGNDVEIIDSIIDKGDRINPLICLAKCIEKMAEADAVVVLPGWECSRGCKVEVDCALMYKIEHVMFIQDLDEL